MANKIIIAGAGISALSCAYLLAKKKMYDITIVAKEFSPNITSNKAAAFWFPYHVRNDKRGIAWVQRSYEFYKEFSKIEATGISIKTLQKFLRKGMAENEPEWLEFMPKGSTRKMEQSELPDLYDEGYEVQVPLIETQIFLPWLMRGLHKMNVLCKSKLITDLTSLTTQADLVFNCTGYGSRQLCNDEMLIPVRGQVGLLSPIENMHIYLDNETPLYLVPRHDAIIVGGTYEEGEELLQTDKATINRLLQNAYNVFPYLQQQKVLGSWAGIRPYRNLVRVEREKNSNIIHNYGHGGSGFTLSFGCAEEAINLM